MELMKVMEEMKLMELMESYSDMSSYSTKLHDLRTDWLKMITLNQKTSPENQCHTKQLHGQKLNLL